jgi:drug/metabolite transporter (DMT)-like permease
MTSQEPIDPERRGWMPIPGPDFVRRFAVPLIALSSLLISVNGLMLRSIESATQWQVIFARQTCFVTALLLVLSIRYRRALPGMIVQVGWPGVFGGLSLALANAGFIVAMSNTTVANTLFTLSSAPLMTAVLARVLLREQVAKATVIAILIAMVGIAVMVREGLEAGSAYGILIALGCALCFSLFVICLRLGRNRNMIPTSLIGASLGAVIGLVGSGFDIVLPARDFLICLFWGAGIVTTVHIVFTAASRYVPGAEIMLITLIEFTIGPVWVWLAYGERPTSTALAGGSLVLGAVAARSLLLLRR